jgi:hypothetical protein
MHRCNLTMRIQSYSPVRGHNGHFLRLYHGIPSSGVGFGSALGGAGIIYRGLVRRRDDFGTSAPL